MTKLTRFTNGKVSNMALNLLANTAWMVATALTLTTAVLLITSAASADESSALAGGAERSCRS